MSVRRSVQTLAMALALTSGLAPSVSVAQDPEPAPADGEGQGRSLDGYFATGALAGLALFLICKSARRS